VIEAKRLGAGVEGALEQAKGYVERSASPRRDRHRWHPLPAVRGARGFAPAYANLAA
jgi:hypothetical protein